MDRSFITQARCWTAEDCSLRNSENNNFCDATGFPAGHGQDLGTVVYYKIIKPSDAKPNTYTFQMKWSHPTWAIMTALKGVDTSADSIVRNVATTSNDRSRTSVFPEVGGNKGDILLLNMAFDDPVTKSAFLSPRKTRRIGYILGKDETGFLYGRKLESKRKFRYETRGEGNSKCKDALISMTIRTKTG